jgi:bacteriocin-like protein
MSDETKKDEQAPEVKTESSGQSLPESESAVQATGGVRELSKSELEKVSGGVVNKLR